MSPLVGSGACQLRTNELLSGASETTSLTTVDPINVVFLDNDLKEVYYSSLASSVLTDLTTVVNELNQLVECIW